MGEITFLGAHRRARTRSTRASCAPRPRSWCGGALLAVPGDRAGRADRRRGPRGPGRGRPRRARRAPVSRSREIVDGAPPRRSPSAAGAASTSTPARSTWSAASARAALARGLRRRRRARDARRGPLTVGDVGERRRRRRAEARHGGLQGAARGGALGAEAARAPHARADRAPSTARWPSSRDRCPRASASSARTSARPTSSRWRSATSPRRSLDGAVLVILVLVALPRRLAHDADLGAGPADLADRRRPRASRRSARRSTP